MRGPVVLVGDVLCRRTVGDAVRDVAVIEREALAGLQLRQWQFEEQLSGEWVWFARRDGRRGTRERVGVDVQIAGTERHIGKIEPGVEAEGVGGEVPLPGPGRRKPFVR